MIFACGLNRVGQLNSYIPGFLDTLGKSKTLDASRFSHVLEHFTTIHIFILRVPSSTFFSCLSFQNKALFRRAWALEELDQLPNARSDLKAALVLEPANPKAKEALGRVEGKQAKKDAAAAALAKGQVNGHTANRAGMEYHIKDITLLCSTFYPFF